jgi:hypothetical protein
VFIHLDQPTDKLELMLSMLHKLYALVSAHPPPQPSAMRLQRGTNQYP